jgi:probable aminopeptidase NPEPL1
MQNDLTFTADPAALAGAGALQVIGRKARLEAADVLALLPEHVRSVWVRMLKGDPGDQGRTATSWLDGDLQRVNALVVPDLCSRHNSPSRTWAWPRLLPTGRATDTALIVALDDRAHAFAAALGVARSMPTFSARSKPPEARTRVLMLAPDGPVDDPSLALVAEAARKAAEWVDAPPDRLGPDAFVALARQIGVARGASVHVLRRRELVEQGLGGLAAVGAASRQEPALVVLDHPGAGDPVCWVGKGVVYDTGGLSLKEKTSMVGMKGDMGGAAAVLAAFVAAVEAQVDYGVLAVLCLAENAVGPEATRPDDILTLYSGKTVEVNNTDAEGRLVLADGLAWVCEAHNPDVLIDLATLTGAALVATGKVHAAVVSNDEGLEAAAVAAGLRAGEPVFPLLYAPELLRREFRSPVADMRNSVKDRNNAQSSCAAQFIANHLPSPAPRWLHVDLAGPAWDGENRGTGYGVGLLLTLLGQGAPL